MAERAKAAVAAIAPIERRKLRRGGWIVWVSPADAHASHMIAPRFVTATSSLDCSTTPGKQVKIMVVEIVRRPSPCRETVSELVFDDRLRRAASVVRVCPGRARRC